MEVAFFQSGCGEWDCITFLGLLLPTHRVCVPRRCKSSSKMNLLPHRDDDKRSHHFCATGYHIDSMQGIIGDAIAGSFFRVRRDARVSTSTLDY